MEENGKHTTNKKVPCLTLLGACFLSSGRKGLTIFALRDGEVFPACSAARLIWWQRISGGRLNSARVSLSWESPDWIQLSWPTILASSVFTFSELSSSLELQNAHNDHDDKSLRLRSWCYNFTCAHSRVVPMRLWCFFPRWWRRRGNAPTAAALTTPSALCNVLEKTHTRHVTHTPGRRRARSDTQSAWISGARKKHTIWRYFGVLTNRNGLLKKNTGDQWSQILTIAEAESLSNVRQPGGESWTLIGWQRLVLTHPGKRE